MYVCMCICLFAHSHKKGGQSTDASNANVIRLFLPISLLVCLGSFATVYKHPLRLCSSGAYETRSLKHAQKAAPTVLVWPDPSMA